MCRIGKRCSPWLVLSVPILAGLANGQETKAPARSDSKTPRAVIRPVFHDPQPVTVWGYDDQIMEPFLTRDGKFLLFNNSNDPREKTDLHLAEKMSERSFRYVGKLSGANSHPTRSRRESGSFALSGSGWTSRSATRDRSKPPRDSSSATLSPDERMLYYHKQKGGRFVLECLSR